jgi:hypothetical protein
MFKLVITSDNFHSSRKVVKELETLFWDDLLYHSSREKKLADGTFPENYADAKQEDIFGFAGKIWRNTDAHAQAVKRGLIAHVEPV